MLIDNVFTKLVGLSYHCNPSPHLQSMMLATDYIGMSILLDPALAFSVPSDDPPHGTVDDPVGYSRCYEQFNQAVSPLSVPISRVLPLPFFSSFFFTRIANQTANHITGPQRNWDGPAHPVAGVQGRRVAHLGAHSRCGPVLPEGGLPNRPSVGWDVLWVQCPSLRDAVHEGKPGHRSRTCEAYDGVAFALPV